MKLQPDRTETIVNPLQKSDLYKKGLCDYVINIASGCLHGCTFCYVPSTPVIRMRKKEFKEQGIEDAQQDWGQYLFIRQDIPEKLDSILSRKTTWQTTPSGKGVVLLCSGTDPYQNLATAKLTREIVEILLAHKKRVRILTRSPLWVNDLDILCNENVTVGMSLPYLDDSLSRQIEPHAPLPSDRYKALLKGAEAGCRIYIAIAPTPPSMDGEDFRTHLELVTRLNPEVIFWEPINTRGLNLQKMKIAKLDFVDSLSSKQNWAENFIRQWGAISLAAQSVGCGERLHIWADVGLKGFYDKDLIKHWLNKPSIEEWK